MSGYSSRPGALRARHLWNKEASPQFQSLEVLDNLTVSVFLQSKVVAGDESGTAMQAERPAMPAGQMNFYETRVAVRAGETVLLALAGQRKNERRPVQED